MRIIRLIVALACLAAGVVVGWLNQQPVGLDLGAIQWHAPLGVVVIVAVLAGAVLGGLALAASGLRAQTRRDGTRR